MKNNILTGIKPTGKPTIGNYIGMLSRLKDYQSSENQCFYFIPNLHDLTNDLSIEQWHDHTYDLLSWVLSLGVDPGQSYIYLESDIPAISQLMVVCNYFATMGELSRQTQFKDKSQKGSHDHYAGLFEYPVLMAADILVFDTNMVPVGDDQKQHVELARDIAQRFNHHTKTNIMTIPEPTIPLAGARIKSLTDPYKKMSKSEETKSYILLEDKADDIRHKIKSATTDSLSRISYDHDKQPAIANLIDIYHCFSGLAIEDIVALYQADISYKRFKDDLTGVLVEKLAVLQQNYNNYKDQAEIDRILKDNRDKLRPMADIKTRDVYKALGVVYKF